jgi:hypothetical protein
MANLIIKSSADNLVLQGSDASPAITVGATGTTTFAENATLSGTANNLGTVGSGNINALYGSGGVQEYSRGGYSGAVTVTVDSPWTTGMEAKLNPASGADICVIAYTWSSQDNTTQTATSHHLLVDGSQHLKWADHMNHTTATSEYRSTTLWAIRTASEFGWSSGTITFGISVCGQSAGGTFIWNDSVGGDAEDGNGLQMSFIQAWRYPSTAVTAGTNA